MRQLHHSHLLRLHCCFLEGDTLWLVMPYVDAGNLAVIMQTCAPMVVHHMMKQVHDTYIVYTSNMICTRASRRRSLRPSPNQCSKGSSICMPMALSIETSRHGGARVCCLIYIPQRTSLSGVEYPA